MAKTLSGEEQEAVETFKRNLFGVIMKNYTMTISGREQRVIYDSFSTKDEILEFMEERRERSSFLEWLDEEAEGGMDSSSEIEVENNDGTIDNFCPQQDWAPEKWENDSFSYDFDEKTVGYILGFSEMKASCSFTFSIDDEYTREKVIGTILTSKYQTGEDEWDEYQTASFEYENCENEDIEFSNDSGYYNIRFVLINKKGEHNDISLDDYSYDDEDLIDHLTSQVEDIL